MTRLGAGRLQNYVVRGGEQVFAPPYIMNNTGLHIFIVRAGKNALSNVLDREINDPWLQAFRARGVLHRWVPTYDWVAFVFADVKALKPLEPLQLAQAVKPGSDLAKVFENTAAEQLELVIMLPVTDEPASPSISSAATATSSVFYLPFVFNSFPPSIVAGREVYGYPKEYAEFEPDPRQRPGAQLFGGKPRWTQLTVSAHAPVPSQVANGVQQYELRPCPYIYVDRGRSVQSVMPPDQTRRRTPTERSGAGPGAIEILPDTGWPERGVGAARRPPRSAAATAANAQTLLEQCHELLSRQMQYMFLRQFRDPNLTAKASYQAIVLGDIVPHQAIIGESWDSLVDADRYVLRFPNLANGAVQNPIACSLGISNEVPADGVLRLPSVDIAINAANVVWDRS